MVSRRAGKIQDLRTVPTHAGVVTENHTGFQVQNPFFPARFFPRTRKTDAFVIRLSCRFKRRGPQIFARTREMIGATFRLIGSRWFALRRAVIASRHPFVRSVRRARARRPSLRSDARSVRFHPSPVTRRNGLRVRRALLTTAPPRARFPRGSEHAAHPRFTTQLEALTAQR